jgi:hypothetical protein
VLGASLFSNGNAIQAEEADTEQPEGNEDGPSETEQADQPSDQV